MGYSGQTFAVPLNDIGYNANPNVDNIPSNSMIDSSKNVNIHEGGLGKRGGTSHLDNVAMSGAPRIMGLYDYTPTSGTQYIVRCTNDGNIYIDATTTVVSSLGTNKYSSFAKMNDKLYICNGYNQPLLLDGATPSVLGNLSDDWSGAGYYPSQMLLHGYGNSERLWAIGVNKKSGGINYLNYLYYSNDNDGHSDAVFNGDVSGQIYIETGSRHGLTAMVEFQDRLICFSKEYSFIILDADASTTNWGYKASGWKGGCSHSRLAVVTPNDIVCMMDDGEIYSVTATQNYGDYKSASLTRPAFIHKWISDYIDLSQIDRFHAIYDPQLRCINFFMVRKGQSGVNVSLCYFIDKTPDKAWTIKDNLQYPSGFNASCSAIVKESDLYRTYTGDHAGYVWKLETSNSNDNGNGYLASVKLPPLSFGNIRTYKRFDKLRIKARPIGLLNMSVIITIDNVQSITTSISMSGVGLVFGSIIFGSAIFGPDVSLVEHEVEIGTSGNNIQSELYNGDANVSFYLSQELFDWKPLGIKP